MAMNLHLFSGPSFTKSLTDYDSDDDSASIFEIPSQLVKSYGDVLPPYATLKFGVSEKSWRVRIEKFRDHYFFTDGWEKFAQEVHIKSLEYLSFNFVGLSEPKLSSTSNDDMDNSYSQDINSGDSGIERIWRFSKELKEHPFPQTLAIPEDFAVGTGLVRDREIKLCDEKGKDWKVRVVEGQCGQFAMADGWREFLVGNNVVVGCTISFEFVRTSSDYVIETSIKRKVMGKPNKEDVELEYEPEPEPEQDDSFVFLEESEMMSPSAGNRSIKIPELRSTRSQTRRKRAKEDDSVHDKHPKRKSVARQLEEGSSSKPTKSHKKVSEMVRQLRPNRMESVDDGKVQSVVDKEANMAYQKAKSFKSENPFVISLMQPSYVAQRYILSIPRAFVKKYLVDGKKNDLKLCDLHGKIWNVSCTPKKSSGAKIRGEWRLLVEYHNLKVGDVCVFEVNKLNHLLWNVIFYRN